MNMQHVDLFIELVGGFFVWFAILMIWQVVKAHRNRGRRDDDQF